MFQSDTPFYFNTTRKIAVAFGTLFNNIKIQRFNNDGSVRRVLNVPLSYAGGEKWYTHRIQDVPAQEGVQVKMTLPRIAFEMTNIQYDSARKLNTLNRMQGTKTDDVSMFLSQLNPSPYDFQFDVSIATKTADDGLQIIEQILPNFQPSFNLNVKDIPELSIVKDIPVIFSGITKTNTYEGSYDEQRVFTWDLSFVAKGYMYPAIRDADIIRKVYANIYKDKDMTQKNTIIKTEVSPIGANIEDEWSAKTEIFNEDSIDSNGEPV